MSFTFHFGGLFFNRLAKLVLDYPSLLMGHSFVLFICHGRFFILHFTGTENSLRFGIAFLTARYPCICGVRKSLTRSMVGSKFIFVGVCQVLSINK